MNSVKIKEAKKALYRAQHDSGKLLTFLHRWKDVSLGIRASGWITYLFLDQLKKYEDSFNLYVVGGPPRRIYLERLAYLRDKLFFFRKQEKQKLWTNQR